MGKRKASVSTKPYKGKFWIAVYQKDEKRGEKLVDTFDSPLSFSQWVFGKKIGTSRDSDNYQLLQQGYRRINQAWHYVTGNPYPWKRNGFQKDGIEYYIYFVAIDEKDFDEYLSLDCDRIFDNLYPEGSYKLKLKRKEDKQNEQNQSISKENH